MAFTNKVVPVEEQETVIQFNRDSDTATIYTTDSTVINKLDKRYERTRISRNGKQIAAIEYDVPKKFISYKTKTRKLNISSEQKKERMRVARKTLKQYQ